MKASKESSSRLCPLGDVSSSAARWGVIGAASRVSDYNDCKVNEHSVAVRNPAATVVNDIEGTQYVTASLVLPSVYMLIHKVRKG